MEIVVEGRPELLWMLVDPGPDGVEKRVIRLPPAGAEKLTVLITSHGYRTIDPLEQVQSALHAQRQKAEHPAGM